MFLEELTERMTEDWTEVYFTEGYRFKGFHACVVGFWKDLEKTRRKKNQSNEVTQGWFKLEISHVW